MRAFRILACMLLASGLSALSHAQTALVTPQQATPVQGLPPHRSPTGTPTNDDCLYFAKYWQGKSVVFANELAVKDKGKVNAIPDATSNLVVAACEFWRSNCAWTTPPSCQDYIAQVQQAAGRPLSPLEIIQIAACTGCSNGSCTSGNLSPTTEECGDDCDKLFKYIVRRLICHTKSPVTGETEAMVIADAVCDFLQGCGSVEASDTGILGPCPAKGEKGQVCFTQCLAVLGCLRDKLVLDKGVMCELFKSTHADCFPCAQGGECTLCSVLTSADMLKYCDMLHACSDVAGAPVACRSITLLLDIQEACMCAAGQEAPDATDKATIVCAYMAHSSAVDSCFAPDVYGCLDVLGCLMQTGAINEAVICAMAQQANCFPGSLCEDILGSGDWEDKANSQQTELPTPGSVVCPRNARDMRIILTAIKCYRQGQNAGRNPFDTANTPQDSINGWFCQWLVCTTSNPMNCNGVNGVLRGVLGGSVGTSVAAHIGSDGDCPTLHDGSGGGCQPGTDPDNPEDAAGADSECPGGETENPVTKAYGNKIESAIDVDVTLPGGSFQIRRSYNSAVNLTTSVSGISLEEGGQPNLVGWQWTLSCFRRARWDYGIDASNNVVSVVGADTSARRSTRRFVHDPTSSSWIGPGATNERFIEVTLNIDGHAWAVLRQVRPGRGFVDYVAGTDAGTENLEGYILHEQDQYGNSNVYRYDTLWIDDGTFPGLIESSELQRVRLSEIRLGCRASSTTAIDTSQPAAMVRFTWNPLAPTAGEPPAQLGWIEVKRLVHNALNELEWITTDRVRYRYAGTPADKTVDWLGYAGDLVEVKRSTLLNTRTGSGETEYMRATHYRYHSADQATTSGFGGPDKIGSGTSEMEGLAGYRHQLKAVIDADQIELLAAASSPIAAPSPSPLVADGQTQPRRIEAALEKLWNTPDLGTAVTGLTTGTTIASNALDLASKVIGYGVTEGDTARQFVLGSCGCGGGAHGQRIDYTYVPGTWLDTGSGLGTLDGVMIRLEEYVYDSGTSSYVLLRTKHTDTVFFPLGDGSSVPLPINEAVVEPGSGGRVWATHTKYDFTPGVYGERPYTVKKMYTATAVASYTPALTTTTIQSRASLASGATGLVHEYEYTGDKRLKKQFVENADGSNKSLITAYTYSSSPGFEWLVTKVEKVRTEGSASLPPSSSDVEEVVYSYGLFSGAFPDAIQWVKRTEEAELSTENGPGGTYSSAAVFDSTGRQLFSINAVGTVQKRVYPADDVHGRPTEVRENAGSSGVPVISGITPSNNSDGLFVTSYLYDALGRVVLAEGPTGVRRGTLRWLTTPADPVWRVSSTVELNDLPVWTAVGSPHQLVPAGSQFDGTIVAERASAGGRSLERSEYKVDNPSSYAPEDGALVFGDEAARGSTTYTVNGQRYRVRAWPHVPSSAIRSGGWHNDEFFFYDSAGRVRFRVEPMDVASGGEPQVGSATSPTATVTEYVYDAVDRVTDVYIGTDLLTSGSNRRKVSSYRYDEKLISMVWQQTAGNGKLTSVDAFPDASSTRTARTLYDWRDRAIASQPALPPYGLVRYDNLGRLVEHGSYTSMPSWSGGALPSTNRVSHTLGFYSQRGVLYRTQPSMTPGSSFTAGIQTDAWFDAAGRTLEVAAPSQPAVKRVYDALGRVVVSASSDRGGDAKPGAAGNHADAGEFIGDTVFEQVNVRYDSASGLPDLVTKYVRRHDIAETGSSQSGRLDHGDQNGVAVRSYTGYGYDVAYRLVRTVAFGTNLSTDVTANGGTVNMGKDVFATGGAAPTWSATTTPDYNTTGYENAIVHATAYGFRGMVDTTTDSLGRKTKFFYDDLGRTIGVAENYTSASISWNSADGRWGVTWPTSAVPAPDPTVVQRNPDTDAHDRMTTTVFDGGGRRIQAVAHVPTLSNANAVQVTQYVYGTTLSDSDAASKNLLRKVVYPDQTTSSGDLMTYSYNRLGELKSQTDQNGTVHTYTRDAVGRVTMDAVTTFGSITDGGYSRTIDQTVKAITVVYDSAGRMESVKSTSDAAGTTPVNGVEFEYTNLHQLFKLRQNGQGAAVSTDAKTREFIYAHFNADYATYDANYTRVAYLQYPSGMQVAVGYGGGGALPTAEDRVSRASSLTFFSSHIANYQYNGLAMPAVVDYATMDIQLDRTIDRAGDRAPYPATPTQTAGVYPGFDRFGRLKRQVWVYGDTATQTSGQRMTRKAISEIEYTYDRGSNQTGRYDITLQSNNAMLTSRKYQTDNLERVRESLKGRAALGTGDINNALPTFTLSSTGSAYWSLDATGNWLSQKFDGGGGTSGGLPQYDQTSTFDGSYGRTHTAANAALDSQKSVGGSTSGQPLVPFGYDKNGNHIRRGAASSPDLLYTYDAWNRLVKVERKGSVTQPVNEFSYNGLHWCTRIKEANGHREFPTTEYTAETTRWVYHTASWQPAYEEKDISTDGTVESKLETVFGLSYIDEIVATRLTWVGDAPQAPVYSAYDGQYSVVARLEDRGVLPRLTERVTYTEYGFPTTYTVSPADVTDASGLDLYAPDGSVTSADLDTFTDWYAASDPRADIADDAGNVPPVGSNSGVTPEDLAAFEYYYYDEPPPSPREGVSALPDHGDGGFCGYAWQPGSAVYLVRHRVYDPQLGRWLQRDPAGYVDGMSLYQYGRGGPGNGSDPSGLDFIWPSGMGPSGGESPAAPPPPPVGGGAATPSGGCAGGTGRNPADMGYFERLANFAGRALINAMSDTRSDHQKVLDTIEHVRQDVITADQRAQQYGHGLSTNDVPVLGALSRIPDTAGWLALNYSGANDAIVGATGHDLFYDREVTDPIERTGRGTLGWVSLAALAVPPAAEAGWAGRAGMRAITRGALTGEMALGTGSSRVAGATSRAITADAAPGAMRELCCENTFRFFWSGGQGPMSAAARLASETGGITLEMTPGGSWLSRIANHLPDGVRADINPMWDMLSADFAAGAERGVFVTTEMGPSPTSAWTRIESRILNEQGIRVPTVITDWMPWQPRAPRPAPVGTP
ncbi:MAG TPA: RHS repeat-associated core domain-containing protein [Phycisphaerales bacterium]|nr:RHS repeat-associated core domain-containing protein [Phycisphaerales bacterium]